MATDPPRTSDENVTVIGDLTPERMQAFALGVAGALYRIEQIKARWAREDARKSESVVRPPLSDGFCGMCRDPLNQVCTRCGTCAQCGWDDVLRRTTNSHGSCLVVWLQEKNAAASAEPT